MKALIVSLSLVLLSACGGGGDAAPSSTSSVPASASAPSVKLPQPMTPEQMR